MLWWMEVPLVMTVVNGAQGSRGSRWPATRSASGGVTMPKMDVSKYKTVGEWYADVRGRVPIQMAQALEKVMKERKLTLPQAYRLLVELGQIIEIDETN